MTYIDAIMKKCDSSSHKSTIYKEDNEKLINKKNL